MNHKCIVKKLYEIGTPYIQLGGYLTLMATLISGLWMVYSFIAQSNATAAAMTDYEAFKTDTKVKLAEIQQEVHDIHGWVKPARHR